MPHTLWTKPGLTPAFDVSLPRQSVQTVFLRVRNYTPTVLPIYISRAATHERWQLYEALALGVVLGLLAAMMGVSVLRYVQHHDPADLGAAAYAALIVATIAQLNGAMASTVCQSLPEIANGATKMASSIAVGGTLLHFRVLYASSVHYHRFDRLLGVAGFTIALTGMCLPLIPPDTANLMESSMYVLATILIGVGTYLSWKRGSSVWQLLAVSSVPQALCVLWLASETFGWVAPL